MTEPVDPRVRHIIDTYRPHVSALMAKTHRCPLGGFHKVIIGYGVPLRTNVCAFKEKCELGCLWDDLPTVLQMHPRDCMLCLEAISQLDPVPYDDEPFQTWCVVEAIRLMEQHDGFPELIAAVPPPAAGRSDPWLEDGPTPAYTVPVTIYVYMEDGQPPIRIDARGTLYQSVVQARLYQPASFRALAQVTPPGQHNEFQLWNRLRNCWVDIDGIKRTYLLQGEGLVYRRVGVTNMPGCDLHISLTTNAAFATAMDLNDSTNVTDVPDDILVGENLPPATTPASASHSIKDPTSTPQPEFVQGSSHARSSKRAREPTVGSTKRRRLEEVIEISSDEEDNIIVISDDDE
ncbi:hypothetical protein C8Q76DRAFT_698908 [Earliella scabrosa]|nr:hypothetical protein C8Q76DRAFT_698908 [Earliella scabrosa]